LAWTAGFASLSAAVPAGRGRPLLRAVAPVSAIGFLIGPTFAGVLASRFGMVAPFAVLAGLLAITLGALGRARVPESCGDRPEPLRRTFVLGGAGAGAAVQGFTLLIIGLMNVVWEGSLPRRAPAAAAAGERWVYVALVASSLLAGVWMLAGEPRCVTLWTFACQTEGDTKSYPRGNAPGFPRRAS
jgi:hypothetical protein